MAIGTSLRTASAISASLANTPVYRARRCIANYNPATILNFTVSGSTFASFSASTAIGGAGPADVQVDGGGNLWVANVDPNETATGSNVVKMSTSGTVIKNIASNRNTGVGPIYVLSIAIEPGASGNVWMANGGNNGVLLYNNAGTLVTSSTAGAIGQPWGAVIDSSAMRGSPAPSTMSSASSRQPALLHPASPFPRVLANTT